MELTSSFHPQITLHPRSASSEKGLDVKIRLIASGRTIPHSGGVAGRSGTALFGYGSIPYRTIWCVVPTFDGGDAPLQLRRALLQGLQRAAIHDLQKVGIELAPVCGSALPPETVAAVVVRAVRHFAGEAFQLEEFRLIGCDAGMFEAARNLIFQADE